VSRYNKNKSNLDFTEARDSEWQWHQLGRMQVCTSLQTDNHASTPLLTPLGSTIINAQSTQIIIINNSHDNVYGAVIMTEVIARVHLVHLMNAD